MTAPAPPAASPPFSPGDAVRVRNDWPESRGPAHVRTPHFLRGRAGRVERWLGDFPDPGELAFGRPAPLRPLFHVAFPQPALFGEGTAGDDLVVELYAHWLERPIEAAGDAAPTATATAEDH